MSLREWLPSLKDCVPVIGFGAAVILGGAYLQRDRIRLRTEGMALPGKVVDFRPSRDRAGSAYAPVVEFRDPRGNVRRYTSDMSSSWSSYHVGESVTMLYHPATGKAAIRSFSDLYGPMLMITAFGVFFVLFGLAPYLIALTLYFFPGLSDVILKKLGTSLAAETKNRR